MDNINYDLRKLHKKYLCNVLSIMIRDEVFTDLIINHLPREDAIIGFQMKVDRYPNVYDEEFWYHFTNKY